MALSQNNPTPQPDIGLGVAAVTQDEANFVTSAVNWARRGVTGAVFDMQDDVAGRQFNINEYEGMIKPEWSQVWKNRLRDSSSRGEFYNLWEQYYFQETADDFRKSDPVVAGATNLAYGVFDPVNLIPWGAASKFAKGKSFAVRGLKGAAIGSGVGLGLAGAEEAGYALTSDSRTASETAWNLVGSTAISLIFGAGGAAFKPFIEFNQAFSKVRNPTSYEKSLEEPLMGVVEDLPGVAPFKTQKLDADTIRTMGQKVTRTATGENLPFFYNSYSHLRTSKSESARDVAAVFDNPGLGGDARTLLNARDITERRELSAFDNAYSESGAAFKKAADNADPNLVKSIGGRNNFDTLVHRYVVGDALTGDPGMDAAIKRVGDYYVERVGKIFNDDYLSELTRAGKIDEEVASTVKARGPKYAANYMARIYNQDNIRANPQGFKDFIRKNLPADKLGDEDFYEDLDSVVLDRILNSPRARSETEEYFPRGLTPRKLSINDLDLVDGGYLISDIRRSFNSVVRKYVPDTLLLRAFDDIKPESIFGAVGTVKKMDDGSLQRVRGSINDEYAEMAKGVSAKEVKAIEAERMRTLDSVRFMFDDFRYKAGLFNESSQSPYTLVRNFDNIARRGLQTFKNVASYTMLRSAAIRDLPQLANTLYRENLGEMTKLGMNNVYKSFKLDRSLKTLEKEDLRAMTVGMNVMLNKLNYVTANDYRPALGVWGKVTDFAERAGNYSRNNLLLDGSNVMRDFFENIGTSIATNRILKSVKSGKFSDSFLQDYGISEDVSKRIAQQFDEFGESMDAVGGKYFISGVSQWTDKEAADAFMGANWNFIRSITLDGDFQSNAFLKNTVAGQVIGTFTGFMNAMVGRTLVPGIRRSYGATAFAMAAGVGMYGFGRMVSDLMTYGEVADEDQFYDRYVGSGIVNVTMFRYGDLAQRTYYGLGTPEAEDVMQGNLVGKYGLQPEAFVGAPAAAAMGTTRGALAALKLAGQEVKSATTGEVAEGTSSDLRAIRNIVPARNFMFSPMLLNEVEDQARDYYGLPPRKSLNSPSTYDRLRQ